MLVKNPGYITRHYILLYLNILHIYKTSSSTPVCSVLTLVVMMLDCRLLKLSLRLKFP